MGTMLKGLAMKREKIKGIENIKKWHWNNIDFAEKSIFSYVPKEYHTKLLQDLESINLEITSMINNIESDRKEITITYLT